MGSRERSVLSREPLTYAISAEIGGAPWEPGVGSTFEGAYLASPLARPAGPDWVAGSFDTSPIGTVRGLVMIGPGSTKVLALGTWYEWVRLTDPVTGVQVVDQVGSVVIA
jgi:hypothetical protein